MKKGNLRTAFLFLLVAFLVLFGAASFIANAPWKSEDRITAHTISIDNNNAIRVPNSNQDVPNEDEGTIVLWTKTPVSIFDQFSDARDYIIFYSATNIAGLRIVYNIKEQQFEAGTPLMVSPKIDIFDDRDHQLVYTFTRDGEQALFLDGAKVASSGFNPLDMSQVTGFMVAVSSVDEADMEGIEVAMYDRHMTEEQLQKI